MDSHPGARQTHKRKWAEEVTLHINRVAGAVGCSGQRSGKPPLTREEQEGALLGLQEANRSCLGHGPCAGCRAPRTTGNPGLRQARQATKPTESPGVELVTSTVGGLPTLTAQNTQRTPPHQLAGGCRSRELVCGPGAPGPGSRVHNLCTHRPPHACVPHRGSSRIQANTHHYTPLPPL